jgi:ankyrin repeat protein
MEVLDPVVRILRESNIPVQHIEQRDAITIMHRAVALGNLESIHEFEENVNASDSFGLTPLHYTVLLPCCGKNFSIARKLIQLGADPGIASGKEFGRYNALHFAAAYGNDTFIRLFLDTEIDVNMISAYDGAAINVASRKQFVTSMELLLGIGKADINATVCIRLQLLNLSIL